MVDLMGATPTGQPSSWLTNGERDAEVEDTLPPKLKREDPKHTMMDMPALQPQQVQLAVNLLMQGRTIPLQYGR